MNSKATPNSKPDPSSIPISQLRMMLAQLSMRAERLRAGAQQLLSIEVVVPDVVLSLPRRERWDESSFEDGCFEDEYEEAEYLASKRRTPIALLSEELVLDRIDDKWVAMAKYLKHIAAGFGYDWKITPPEGFDVEAALRTSDPNTDSWTAFELETIRSTYRNQICELAKGLRDCSTWLEQEIARSSKLPAEFRSLCGLGELPLMDLGVAYSDRDFEGGEYCEPDQRPKLLSRKWLAPLFGPEIGERILEIVQDMRAQSAPRPGEPSVLKFFSSRETNGIAFEDLALDQGRPAEGSDHENGGGSACRF